MKRKILQLLQDSRVINDLTDGIGSGFTANDLIEYIMAKPQAIRDKVLNAIKAEPIASWGKLQTGYLRVMK